MTIVCIKSKESFNSQKKIIIIIIVQVFKIFSTEKYHWHSYFTLTNKISKLCPRCSGRVRFSTSSSDISPNRFTGCLGFVGDFLDCFSWLAFWTPLPAALSSWLEDESFTLHQKIDNSLVKISVRSDKIHLEQLISFNR